jgi:hypothetical protein
MVYAFSERAGKSVNKAIKPKIVSNGFEIELPMGTKRVQRRS